MRNPDAAVNGPSDGTFHVPVPDGESGAWAVQTFVVSERESERTKIDVAKGDRWAYVPPGTYKRLVRGDTVVMSNTPMEVTTNRTAVHRALGDILLNGLGLGMVLAAVLRRTDVRSVTVIEKAVDVIELVAPTFASDPRVRIIEADAFNYSPARGTRFDVVWHDIWDCMSPENLGEMTELHRRYGRRASWQGSWGRAHCEMLRDRHRWR